jgi:imidazolonepropionase-like amidohydrolase
MKCLLFLCVLCGLAGMSQAQTSQSVLVIRGGILVDVRGGKEVPNSVIVIRGERIAEIATEGKLEIPKGAQIVEAKGKWIIPGMIDSHAHAGDYEGDPLKLYLANGVTTIRNPGGNVTLLRLTREKLESGKMAGPRLYFSGNILDGNPPVWPGGSFLVDSPERARSAVNFLADQGVDFVKVYNNVKEPELAAIIEAARTRGLPVAGHIPRTMTMTRAIEMGMTRLEHIRITGKEMLSAEEAEKIDPLPVGKREAMLWQRFDLSSEKFRGLVQRLAASRVFLDPTLVTDEYFNVSDAETEKSDPNNKYVSAEFVKGAVLSFQNPLFQIPSELKVAAAEAVHKEQRFVGMCNEAGVRIIAGTDGPNMGRLLPGFGLQRELELLVEAWLSPLQALRAATLTAAEALGKEDQLGTLETSKLADLVVLDADPLAAIQNVRKVRAVVQGGKVYEPSGLLEQVLAEAQTKP